MRSMLVLDGDFTARTVLAATLSNAGIAVKTAASLAEARALLAAQAFDALVLELELPDGHGLDLLRELRASDVDALRRMRVVVVSSMHQHAQLARSRSLGVVDYVTKPFSPRELIERLREPLAA
jgi:DNA-binding response OmpR family regulator